MVDDPEQQHGDAEIDGHVEPVRNALVRQEAKQVDVPPIGIGQAVGQDHQQRELMEIDSTVLPDFSAKYFNPPTRTKLRSRPKNHCEKLRTKSKRDLSLALPKKLASIVGEVHRL